MDILLFESALFFVRSTLRVSLSSLFYPWCADKSGLAASSASDRASIVELAQRYHSQFATSEGVVEAEIIAREYLAGMTFDAGDYPGSRAYLHPNLHLSQRLNRPPGQQRCYYILARLAYLYGDYRAARQE